MTGSDDTQSILTSIINFNSAYLLELGDGLRSPQDPLGSVGSHLGCLTVGSSTEQLVKLCDEQLVSSTEVVPDGHPEGEVGVVEGVLYVGDDGLLVHGDREDLASPVDSDDAIAGVVGSSHEDCVRTDSVLVDEDPGLDVVEVNVSVLGDKIDNAVLLRDLQVLACQTDHFSRCSLGKVSEISPP